MISNLDAHTWQGRLVEQHPVYLYDPVNDFVDSQLRERYLLLIAGVFHCHC